MGYEIDWGTTAISAFFCAPVVLYFLYQVVEGYWGWKGSEE